LKTILIFPGSLRKQSLNLRLALYIKALLAEDFHLDLLGADAVDLPLFNEDLENEKDILDKAMLVYERFRNADGLVVVSPEYNGSITAYLKNTVDWVSRIPRIHGGKMSINPFLNKPLLLACATSGWGGGTLGLQSARNVFSYLGCLILAEQLSLPCAAEAWEEDGSLVDPFFNNTLVAMLKRLGSIVENLPISYIET
jgi:chromate reductase, NAD(P)H dehydrogenase (quinone)